MGILDQIAQPQMADIVGALDIRQKRLHADEAKRKEIRMGQLIAEAIPNLKPGSTLERMAKDDPKNFMLVTKAFGIPLNAGDQAQQLADDIDTLYQAAQADPKDAYDRAVQLKTERNAKGLETPQIDKFLEGMEDDPQRTMTGLFVSHRSLNQEEYDKREMMKRKMDQEDRSLDIQEKRITADRSASVNKRFGAQETLKDEAGNLFFATSKMDPSTGDMVGVVAAVDGSDVKPKGKLSATGTYGLTANEKVNQAGAQTNATESAKDMVKYKNSLFEGINSNARTLNKYNFAISQIDKGAESGPVMKLLPNLTEESILVDVVRKEIGMEVLGSGLLGVNPTDRDVNFALQTAIPENLSPKALKRELVRRSEILQDLNAAQEEYYRLVEEEGLSKGDILKMAKQKRQEVGQTGSAGAKEAPKPSNSIDDLVNKYAK